MIIPLKFGKKNVYKMEHFFEEYVCISFYYTNKFMFVMSIKTKQTISYLPHHKILVFEMSSPFTAILSYFKLKALYYITV